MMRTHRSASRLLAVIVLMTAAAPTASAAPVAADAPRRTATRIATAATPTPSVVCSATITPRSAARLARPQRQQLRSWRAFWRPGRPARRQLRGRPATPAIAGGWVCLRTPAQAQATLRLARVLGRSTGADRHNQVVQFPPTLAAPLDIDLPAGSAAGWRMLDVPAVPLRSFASGAMFSTAGWDVVQHVQVGQLKESIVVHSRQGVRTWRWQLHWRGGSAPMLRANGDVLYGHGMVLHRPFIETADGTLLQQLDWQLDGDVLSVRVNDRSLPLPYVLDPASSYPQRIYPWDTTVPGSTVIDAIRSTTPGTAGTFTSGAATDTLGDDYFDSGAATGYLPGFTISDVTAPTPRDLSGVGVCTGRTDCYGALGWMHEDLGGATLPAGPYTLQGLYEYVQSDNGVADMPVTVQLKVKLWKVRQDVDGDIIAGTAVPITGWTAGTAQTWIQGEQQSVRKLMSATVTPLSLSARTLNRLDRLYVEYALSVTDKGKAGSSVRLVTNNSQTWIDFGAAATNTPGTAANLRLGSGPITPTGYTNGTPTLRATLDDPDWPHHIEYQICSAATCSGIEVARTGTSAASQEIGSTNDSWTVPSGTPLPDGIWYMRARTVEDGGDGQVGAWTAIAPTSCTAVEVGPCSRFGVDGTAPPSPASVNDGTGADIDYSTSSSSFDANWSTVVDPPPSSGQASGLSYYEYCISTSAGGTDCSAAAPVPWTSNGTSTTLARTGLSLTSGTRYYICVRAWDAAGNRGSTRCSDGTVVDFTAPSAAWTSWTENSIYLHAPGGASPDLLWYNPSAPLESGITATALVTATDLGSGMQRVVFPDLGAGPAWGAGGTDTTPDASNGWSNSYTFTGGGSIGDPAPNNATAWDVAGLSTGAPALSFRIEPDGAGPTGSTITPLNGLQSGTMVSQTVTFGTDAGSGMGRWALDVQFAPLRDGVCGSWDSWLLGESLSAAFQGSATANSTRNFNIYINDSNMDGIPNHYDSACFRTRVRVFDNVNNSTTVTSSGYAQLDLADPVVDITGPADGSSQRATFAITGTTDDLWAGGTGEYTDTGSGIDHVVVSWELPDGPDADLLPDATGSACTPVTSFTGTWDNLGWSCAWNTSLLADGTYVVTARAYDRSGRMSTAVSRSYVVDNQPPGLAWHSWNEYSLPGLYASGSVAWFSPLALAQPAGYYRLDARVISTQVDHVEFPALGAGWSPAVATNATRTSPSPALDGFTMQYSFTNPAALAEPGVQYVRAYDLAGNMSSVTFEVRRDGTGPTGTSAAVTAGLQGSGTVTVTQTPGTDGSLGSGLNSWRLEYDTAPLANDSCGNFAGTWNTALSGMGAAPTTAQHVVSGIGSMCYRYRLFAMDNVDNVGSITPTSSARRVDLTAPSAAITAPATGASQRSVVNVTGTASDVHSAIELVRVTWTGPTGLTGTACNPAAIAGTSPTWTFSCAWDTSALIDGLYSVSAVARDLAGNESPASTITIRLDNQAPLITFHSFSETTPYTWPSSVTPSLLWYNPAASAGTWSFDVRVDASDAGSLIDRLEFAGGGTGWTPGAAVGVQTVTTGVADRYSQTYTFDSANPGLAAPGVRTVRAYDHAGNSSQTTFELRADSAAPTGSSLSHPTGYVATSYVDLIALTGSDVGSGIASWSLLRSDAVLSNGSCGSWGAYAQIASGTADNQIRDYSAADPGCYRYRLLVTDNVGNVNQVDDAAPVLIDLTPPSGSLELAEATNPQWQYLATPTRIYVNGSTGRSGSFTATTTAAAASGIAAAIYPSVGAGFSVGGTRPGPSPITQTYGWTSPATASSGLATVVRSGSGLTASLPFDVIVDAAAPTGASVTHTGGWVGSTSLSVSYWPGIDSGSGIETYQLEREEGTLAAGTCSWSGTWVAAAAANGPTTLTETIPQGACQRYRVRSTDRVGNETISAASTPAMVDLTPPASASLEFIETNGGFGTALDGSDTIWYRPDLGTIAAPEAFSIRVRVVDPESGVGTITFPSFAGNWSTSTPTPNVDGTTASYRRWATAAEPGSINILAANGAGLAVSVPGWVRVDAAMSSAAAWSIDFVHGYDTNGSTTVTWTEDRSDDRSGFQSADLVRRSWPWASMRCDHTATPVETVLGAAVGGTYTDSTIVRPTCYRYQLRVRDRVENEVLISAVGGGTNPTVFDTSWASWNDRTVVEVLDVFPPSPFDLTLPASATLPAITTGGASPACAAVPTWSSGTPTFTWTASSDAETGLLGYELYLDGTGTLDATLDASTTTWSPGTLTEGGHTLGVRAIDREHNAATAGPGFPTTLRIDATAPTAATTTPAAGTWTRDTTPTLTWTAADANCLARVEVYLDDMITPIAIAAGGETSWTPPTNLTLGLHQWRVEAIDGAGRRTASLPISFGVDDQPPASFSLVTPADGQTVRGSVLVSWNASSDAHSGLASVAAYEVRVDGVLRTTVGPSSTSATVGGLSTGTHTVTARAIDAAGNFADTTTRSFVGYPAIGAPVLDAPTSGAELNAVPVLDWHWSDDGGPAPSSYEVYVDSMLVASTLHPTSDAAIPDPGDGIHSWRIVQHDPYTGAVASATRSFTLDRTAPTNAGPLTRTATTISWPAVIDPSAPVATGVNRLELRIDDGTSPTIVVAASASATSRSFGTLPDGFYTMYLRAWDDAGNTSDSPSIMVINDSTPPTAFPLSQPTALPALPAITNGGDVTSCESQPTYVSARPTFTWQASSDAASGLAGYSVVIDDVTAGYVPAPDTSFTPAAALTSGAHSWYVVALDNFGLTRTSTPSRMTVRVDASAPTVSAIAPGANAFTASRTPTLTWSAQDDNCLARVEVTLDSSVVEMLPASATSWTPAAALATGAHTWSIRAIDSTGASSSTSTRTFTIDIAPPTGVTAVFPTDAGTAPEQMMTFQWTPGTDVSGVTRYDLKVDGVLKASNVTTTSKGSYAVRAGAHTWSIRAYDAVGNFADFPFSFTADPAPDLAAPDPFDLTAPANGAQLPADGTLTWSPAWDFYGVTQYLVYIDGRLVGTTRSTSSSFTPSVGVGSAICTADFDPATGSTCLTNPEFSSGSRGTTTQAPSPGSATWNVASQPGWNTSGSAIGFGDAGVTPITNVPSAGFDGDRAWTAMQYTIPSVPSGAALVFDHRYRTHKVGDSAYDGATIEVMVDTAGDGFANDTWRTTCTTRARALYGVTLRCDYEVVEESGGYDAVMGGADVNSHPIFHQNAFAGESNGMVTTRMQLGQFAGLAIKVRFRMGMDICYSGMSDAVREICSMQGATGEGAAVWRIDNVALINSALAGGSHTWFVAARDAAGNTRPSSQTWTFTTP